MATAMIDPDRVTARVAGVVFIVATAAALASTPLLPDMTDASYLAKVAGSTSQVAGGALLLLVAAFASPGIAVAMYPVMRRSNPALALAAVVFRTLEGSMYVVAVVCLLSLLTVGQQFGSAPDANRAALQAIGDSWRGAREHAALAGVFAFCLGGFSYYYLFFQSRLIPRWLSGWGMLAIVLMLAACGLALFTGNDVTGYALLIIPIAVQEMVLALWLIVKGFASPGGRPVVLAS